MATLQDSEGQSSSISLAPLMSKYIHALDISELINLDEAFEGYFEVFQCRAPRRIRSSRHLPFVDMWKETLE